MHGDRAITLRHMQYLRRPLNTQTSEMLKHVARLWGFDVYLETVDQSNTVLSTQECKWEKRSRIR
jgi:spore cortex formation protein SpoVR/YcgB (stage V sporulation)